MAKFVKGQSGNPGGRCSLEKAWDAATGGKKRSDVAAEALKLAYERASLGPRCDHNGNPNDPDWRFAMQKVLEYSAGKPKEVIEHQFGEREEQEIDWSKVPLEQRERLLAAMNEIALLTASEGTEH